MVALALANLLRRGIARLRGAAGRVVLGVEVEDRADPGRKLRVPVARRHRELLVTRDAGQDAAYWRSRRHRRLRESAVSNNDRRGLARAVPLVQHGAGRRSAAEPWLEPRASHRTSAALASIRRSCSKPARAHAFELRVQREHVPGGRGFASLLEQVRRHVVLGDAADADQLVERRQRRGQLRAADQLGVAHRQMRMRAAPVRAVVEAQPLRQAAAHARSSASRPRRACAVARGRCRCSVRRRGASRRAVHCASASPTPSCQRTWSQQWMPVSWPASRTRCITSAARRPMSGPGSSVPYSSVRTP